MANTMNPQALFEQLELVLANPKSYFHDAEARAKFQLLARKARTATEEPFETLQRIVYYPATVATIRIGQDKKLFDSIAASPNGIDATSLSQTSGIPPVVLETIMDYLCTQDFAQRENGLYKATPQTELFLSPLFKDSMIHFHDNFMPTFTGFNEALGDPHSRKTGFNYGHHTDDTFYAWLNTHPVQQAGFNGFMEAHRAMLPTWLDVVKFESEFAQGVSSEEAVFVDVGGGNGAQCAELKKACPNLKGRVILQDTPGMVKTAMSVDGMETMAYDFFTEQPIKNARAYYLRHIIHNWNDEDAVQILKAQVPAMGPDSRIFIDDKALPNEKPDPNAPGVEYTLALALAMTSMFGGIERRDAHWRRLLDQVGLEVVDIRSFNFEADSVIICKKKGGH